MTDNEIIKALECHAHIIHNTGRNLNCCDCDYIQFQDCSQRMSCDTLDLINRQQAEIERLGRGITFNYEFNEEQVNTIQEQCLTMVKRNAAEIKAEAIKEYKEKLIFEIMNTSIQKPEYKEALSYIDGARNRQSQIIEIINGFEGKEMVGDTE